MGLLRISRILEPLRHARACWVVAILMLCHFALLVEVGGYTEQPQIYHLLGLNLSGILNGWVWQLLTYGFLHGNWSHVILNVLCLLLIGSRLEWFFGSRTILVILMAGVISGGLFHLVLGVTQNSLLVGFSGGCMALLLMQCMISPESRMLPFGISAKFVGQIVLWVEFALALLDPAKGLPFLSQLGNSIASWNPSLFQMGHACHFGGALAGWLAGLWILRPRVTLKSLRAQRAAREGISEG